MPGLRTINGAGVDVPLSVLAADGVTWQPMRTVPKRTNLATNPRASTGFGWGSNDNTKYRLVQNTAVTGHPLGITTAVVGTALTSNYQSTLSAYSVDNLANTAVSRSYGLWVMTPFAGYKAYVGNGGWTTLTANQWTWIQTVPGYPLTGYSSLYVQKATGLAPSGDYAYATGCACASDGLPLTPFFDGTTPSDVDYAYSWTGTAGASASIATP